MQELLTIGDKIRRLRREKQLSMDELAEQCGVTKAAISQYEHNVRLPNAVVVKHLALALEVSADYLCGVE